jgi:hypothetical protein
LEFLDASSRPTVVFPDPVTPVRITIMRAIINLRGVVRG